MRQVVYMLEAREHAGTYWEWQADTSVRLRTKKSLVMQAERMRSGGMEARVLKLTYIPGERTKEECIW